METDYVFNIVMVGDSGVGKSSILRQYKDGKFAFNAVRETAGIDFCIKEHEIDGNDVKLQVWDTAGQERFHSITRGYYRKADAVVVVYDISRAGTFRNLTYWLKEVKKYAKENVHCLLVGNKSDVRDKPYKLDKSNKFDKPDNPDNPDKLENPNNFDEKEKLTVVTTESGKRFADENGLPFMESTARNWDNINKLFVQLARALLDKKPTPQHEEPSEIQKASYTPEASDVQEESDIQKGSTEEEMSPQESRSIFESSAVHIVLDGSIKAEKRRKKRCC